MTGPRARLAGLGAFLLVFNLVAFLWAWRVFFGNGILLSAAVLAYGLGLRHAVDADHIAAIDNVTRKLMQSGDRPLSVGLFFALGHSTIVIVATLVLATAASAYRNEFETLRQAGVIVGTLVSSVFLLGIATANAFVLFSVYKSVRRDAAGQAALGPDADTMFQGRGLLTCIMRPLFGVINRSWQMYPLGILFGLGFDTASEIGLLAMTASQAASGLPALSIMALPVLFTAGMSLVDSLDGILMVRAYDWAFIHPRRKLNYNLLVTAMSVCTAVMIGGVEALGLAQASLHWSGGFSRIVLEMNDRLGLAGFGIVLAFGATWAGAVLLARFRPRGSRNGQKLGGMSRCPEGNRVKS